IGLRGMIDSTGIVTLHWPLGKDPDITGYRVYFANAADHEFSNITPYPIQDTVFVDTLNLNTLTKEIYYQIAAVDRNFNHSERSEILKLIKPDIVPPTTPLISKYFVTDTAVVLNIIPSSSDDVAQHILYRKGEKQNDWIKIKQFLFVNELKNQVVDNQVTGPNYYQYAVQAIDSAGNKSEFSPAVGVRVYKSTEDIQIDGLTAQYNQQSKSVSLKWNKPKADVSYYVIYRKVNQNRYENFASVDADKNSFEDKEILSVGEYQYGIKAIYKNGESKISLSAPVVISKP
ncbi:MAG: fibronectin type III domain-containing protein, partial [Ignavibacterium sp.]